MIVTAVPGRDVDFGDFADLTTVTVVDVRWDGDGVLEVEFASDLTPAEVEAVVRRIKSRNATEETLQRQATAAMQNNRDFLAITTPTQAQAVAQVKALSRQMNGVIRMLLGLLDGAD